MCIGNPRLGRFQSPVRLVVPNCPFAMRCLIKNLLILLCLCMLCGCAYTENRLRDAADMITIAGEFPAAGVAVSGRHFGLAIPLYVGNGGGFGLRSGAVGSYGFKEGIVFPMPVYIIKNLRPSKLDRERGKGYGFDLFDDYSHGGWFNAGQVEVAVGVGVGARAGVNFCEIADFVVGLVGVDICDDDIAGRQESPSDVKEAKLFIDSGAAVEAESNIGYRALHAATSRDSRKVVELLLAKGADVNANNDVGRTCLYLAVEKGYKEMAEILIANGAEVNAQDYRAWTPLHLAVLGGQNDISKLLIRNGANVNARNKNGYTPLHTAAHNGRTEIADFLITNGADVSAKAKDDTTALHWSAKAGHEDMTNLLIAHGADVNAQDGLGRTALSIALEIDHEGIAESLRKHGAIE